MKHICSFFILVAGFAASANHGGLGDGQYSAWTSAAVINRIAEGHESAALRLYQNTFSATDYEFLHPGRLALARMLMIRDILQCGLWNTMSESARLEFLKLTLQNGPLTPVFERELLFYVYSIGSLEAMGYLLDYAEHGSTGVYLGLTGFPSMFGSWRRTWNAWFKSGTSLLKGAGYVRPEEVEPLIQSWVSRGFQHPDQLIALVNAKTSRSALKIIRLGIAYQPGWVQMMSSVQKNRFHFWEKSRACEDDLSPKSEPL